MKKEYEVLDVVEWICNPRDKEDEKTEHIVANPNYEPEEVVKIC